MEASATTQISRLQKKDLKGLRLEYEKVFGKPTKSRNRNQLFTQIARRIQDGQAKGTAATAIKPTLKVKFTPKKRAKVPGGKKKTSAKKTAKVRPIGQRDPRLPKIGTTLTKKYKGKTLNVRVLETGFEYNGQVFRSLSAVAKHITGSIWNGFGFFGLLEEGKKKG